MMRIVEKHTFWFWLLMLLSLGALWLPHYFVTGDGPCHVHNALALKDIWEHGDASFYARYYELNKQWSPNYFSHYCMVGLLYLFDPATVEKLMLSACVLAMGLGFGELWRQSNRALAIALYLVFPLIFGAALYRGFFNYVLSIGMMLGLLGYYYRWLCQLPKRGTWLWLMLGASFLSSVHLVGFFLFVLAAGLMLFYYCLWQRAEPKVKLGMAGRYALIILPGLLMAYAFAQHSSRTDALFTSEELGRWATQLINISSLSILNVWEHRMAQALAMLVGSLLIMAMLRKQQLGVLSASFASMALVCSFIYFFISDELLGGGLIKLRFETLIYIWALLWISTVEFPKRYYGWLCAFALFISISFCALRFLSIKPINELTQSYEKAAGHIADRSYVLNISFNHKGLDDSGHIISASEWILGPHSAQVMGYHKKLVFADNYEARTFYFLLKWKKEQNPYLLLSTGNGLESDRAMIDLQGYNHIAGLIHYIMLFNLNSSDRQLPEYKALLGQIMYQYHAIYLSDNKQIELYQLN